MAAAPSIEFAFATVSQMGHLKPLIPYMSELMRRGHRVTIFCDGGDKYVRELEGAGLGPSSPNTTIVGVHFSEVRGPSALRKEVGLLGILSKGGPLAMASAPLYEAARPLPAVFVCDFFSTAAVDAADKLGVPVVVVFPNPLSMTAMPPQRDRTGLYLRARSLMVSGGEAVFARLLLLARNKERSSRGLPALLEQDIFPCATQDRLMVATTGLGFEFPCSRSPLLHFVGPSPPAAFPPLGPDLASWLDARRAAGTRVVYVAFGTMHTFKAEGVAKLCSELTRVQQEPGQDSIAFLWSLPADQQGFLPPEWAVLAHEAVQVYVTHNGANSTYEALLNEVPMVCVPTGKDQPANAARVKASGTGVVVPGGPAGPVAAALREVLADLPAFVKRIGTVRRALATQGGATRAVDVIEHVAACGGYEHLKPGLVRPSWSLALLGTAALGVAAAAVAAGALHRANLRPSPRAAGFTAGQRADDVECAAVA
ncbi:hypothetical protein EMIHUDRAFT_209124 [Emiliania huxleyi CCMP1516]|uniref:Uncharacterized protein n=2 Tax=Emiliania huxleyi TaxID=2903 RepID=A0A0D3J7Q6_EMIH1|nr:hypothetical protein EMIHUDRAFT_209124 [Emiliania huxleyi CCMP1516]EOD19541.1 hypothetical protein EMIHUDRAFT_209124 [Emiliania huxleyi CCMP1516]|eukprot:XP_005771970.1 hypothetical protein EMIHUDRAFT_209124 [Emiliania huxleyi CCMP1516]